MNRLAAIFHALFLPVILLAIVGYFIWGLGYVYKAWDETSLLNFFFVFLGFTKGSNILEILFFGKSKTYKEILGIVRREQMWWQNKMNSTK